MKGLRLKPTEELQQLIEEHGATRLKDGILAYDLLKRPELSYEVIDKIAPSETELPREVKEQVEIQIKYEGYIKKALQQVDRLKKMENKAIPEDIDYSAITGLATEARQRLEKIRPLTVAQASRISGVNPADISILLVYLEHGKVARVASE